MPRATVGAAQTGHGGLLTKLKKVRLNHLNQRPLVPTHRESIGRVLTSKVLG